MIWLTWRQFRTQAAVVFGAVAVLAAALAATGPHLARLYRARGAAFLNDVGGLDTDLYVVSALALLVLPAVVGMFWGAPLVTRELDAGTHRLVWTHTTRTRWLAAKLGLTGLAAVTAAGLLSAAVTWWAAPIDRAIGDATGVPGPGVLVFPRMSREIFDARGVVPLGYAAFFFVLGVAVGVLVRRTLPAMAILAALFVVVQVGMSMAVRPHLIPPERLTTKITARNLMNVNMMNHVTVVIDRPGAWITAQETVRAGRPVSPPKWIVGCPGTGPSSQACLARLDRLGYRQLVTYQPAGRFWTLQLYETGIYLLLALATAGLCTWWLRHRPS